MKQKQKFDQAGVKLVAIGNGSPLFGKGFKEQLPFEGEVYLDADSSVFKALELKRIGMWEATKRYFMSWSVLKFFSDQSKNYPTSNTSGDGLQTGGVFVVSAAPEGKVLYSFIESEHDGDSFADVDEILRACGAKSTTDEAKVTVAA